VTKQPGRRFGPPPKPRTIVQAEPKRVVDLAIAYRRQNELRGRLGPLTSRQYRQLHKAINRAKKRRAMKAEATAR
jgi:hypothetical protein